MSDEVGRGRDGPSTDGREERPRRTLAERIAGAVATSDRPGATMRKWRGEFDVTQATLAEEMGVAPSVISDYEGGRRTNPGIDLVERYVEALLSVDERRGGERIRQFARVHSAGFDSDVVLDLREYPTAVSLPAVIDDLEATVLQEGPTERINGHTVIDSVAAIRRLSSEDFVRLFGQSTNRALVFTGVTRGEGTAVALRVVSPTPSAVILHGIDPGEVWEFAPELARLDGYALATTTLSIETLLDRLGSYG